MKRVLLTGGAGYIGSHTCIELLKRDYEIYIIDSFTNSSRVCIKKVLEILRNENKGKNYKIKVFEGDIRNKKFVEDCFKNLYDSDKYIDGVIHFAGLKSVNDSIKSPILYWDVNVLGTINLLDIMNKFNCKVFVFSSSATVYGHSQNKRLKESDALKPINPYGSNKLVNENFLYEVFESDNKSWKIANLRYFNPIGAHSSGLIGEYPSGKPNNIFPLILNVAAGESNMLNVYGNNWPTKDGTPIRDYIHVMDLAEGHVKAFEFLLSNNPQFLNLNIGTGKGSTVMELIKTFEDVNKLKLPFTVTDRREGDCSEVVADNSKLISTLNWAPKRTLVDMCKDGWNWKRNNPKGYF